jgi:hypothetical protein
VSGSSSLGGALILNASLHRWPFDTTLGKSKEQQQQKEKEKQQQQGKQQQQINKERIRSNEAARSEFEATRQSWRRR